MSILHATIPPAGTIGAIDQPQWAQGHVVDSAGITFNDGSVQTSAYPGTLNSTSDKQILFNNTGVVVGSASFTWDYNTNSLYLNSASTLGGRVQVNGAFLLGALNGNSRGSGAFDVQSSHSTAAQVASGTNSVALGVNNTAANSSSVAIGVSASATAASALAIGGTVTSSGGSSVAVGNSTTASGANSSALGSNANASGAFDICVGYSSQTGSGGTTQNNSALGYACSGRGGDASAIGDTCTANGARSVAAGYKNTTASNDAGAFGENINLGTNATDSQYSMAFGNALQMSGVGDTVRVGMDGASYPGTGVLNAWMDFEAIKGFAKIFTDAQEIPLAASGGTPKTAILFGNGAPVSAPASGATVAIFIRCDAVSASTVLYVFQGAAWSAVTVP